MFLNSILLKSLDKASALILVTAEPLHSRFVVSKECSFQHDKSNDLQIKDRLWHICDPHRSAMARNDFKPVEEYSNSLQAALAEARGAKPLGSIDPPLGPQEIHDITERIQLIGREGTITLKDARKDYAAIETACRDIFYNLLVSA